MSKILAGRMLCVAILLCLAAVAGAQPEGPVLLRYKFLPGHVDALALSVSGYGQMTISGGPLKTEQTLPLRMLINMPLDIITERVDAAGNGTLRMVYGEMGMQMWVAGRLVHMSMDPNTGAMRVNGQEMTPPPGLAMGQALQEMTLTLSPVGEVVRMTGIESMLKMFPGGGMFAGMSPETLTQMMQTKAATLSVEAVRLGGTWDQKVVLPLPGTTPVESTFTYTLQELGTVAGKRLARLGMSGGLEMRDLTMPASQPGGLPGMPGAMPGLNSKLDLLTVQMEGQMYLPLDGGFLHSARMALELNMDSTAELPEAVGGGEMKTSLQGMKLYYDLTQR